ncbi:MAG: hypothetical protein ACD_9C00263G0004 [uncultured bacterium]|nr:MAG: hypothetical protein ACD_9C00263G0004 [uncultured bacterium]
MKNLASGKRLRLMRMTCERRNSNVEINKKEDSMQGNVAKFKMGLFTLLSKGAVVGCVLNYEDETSLTAACRIRQAIANKQVFFDDSGILAFMCDDYLYPFAGTTSILQELHHLFVENDAEIRIEPADTKSMYIHFHGISYDQKEILGGAISKKTLELVEQGKVGATLGQGLLSNSVAW